jgi:two-component system CheB/CheR fusion protein
VQEHIASITSLLHRRSEHDFSGYKETTLQRRMQVLHIDNALAYIERLKTNQGEVEALFRELLIGVTQFFRDPEAFQALKASALVPLLKSKDKAEPIRVWVPGCSTGEEVYSVAILLREVLQEREDNRAVMIFGTDIDSNAVALARAGRYHKEASGLSPEHFAKWFARDGAEYCPIADIRAMCVFSTHSLVKDPPFSKLDLISCRNVLIYLEEELQDRVMRTFHYSLLPGGYLFLGSAEGTSRNSRLFTARDKKHRILQRRGVGATLPQFQSQDMSTLPSEIPPAHRHRGEDRIDKAIARVMQQYAPAYFVIDRNHEISRFSGAETGAYLEPSEGAASLNLFNIVRKALRPAVRTAVNEALSDGRMVINDNLTMRIDGKPRLLTLIVEPIGGENGAKTIGGCVVAFRDISPAGATASAERCPRAGHGEGATRDQGAAASGHR